MTGYSQEEINLLKTVPWNRLPQALKDKTVKRGDDPDSNQIRDDQPLIQY